MPEGATAVVYGAGAVGLLYAAVAKIEGSKKVIIADIDQGRLDFAAQNGVAHASYLVPMKRGKDIDENLAIAKETAKAVGEIDNVREVDVVFECTGVPSCVKAGIFVSYQTGMDWFTQY
jgi:L-iditol 2-dehydrogenase